MGFFHSLLDDWYTVLFFRNRPFLIETGTVFFLQGGAWLLLILNWDILVQEGRDFISLHYSVFSGVDFVAPWYAVFIAPVLAGCIAVGHSLWARSYVLKNPALTHTAMVVAGAIQLVVFFALVFLIQMNIF